MSNTYRAIDLFAGVGGIRTGFTKAFGNSISFVYASEIDKFAQRAYRENYSDMPDGDITKVKAEDIPAHDVVLAGFPCQAFSSAGKR